MSGRLRIGVLGPFEVARNGKSVEIPPGKARALLTLLLLDRGKVVPVDRLVEQLWEGRPPPSASKQVQVYVARLRKRLGDGLLVTSSPGYALRIDDEQLDVARFESLVESARGEQATAAATRLREALALWRGPALVDFSYDSWAQEEIRRLEELHLEAVEARIEADLALGRHEQAVGELESLGHAHPLRERLQALLMLALYRCGRQAEALEVYRSARHRLIEELGLEPSPELQQLERAILEHDPALAAPPRAGDPAQHREPSASHATTIRERRGRLLLLAGAVVLAAVAAFGGIRMSGSSRALAASADSVGVIDGKGNTLRAVVSGGGIPGGIAAGAGAVWVTDTGGDALLRIDPNRRTVERIPVGHGPSGVAVGDGEVWVVNQLDRTVSEISPRALRQVDKIGVGNGAGPIAFGDRSVWVVNQTDDTISRIDPNAGKVVATIPLGAGVPQGIAVGQHAVWVTSSSGQLSLVDPRLDRATVAYSIGNGPVGVAAGGGHVWVANSAEGTVSRFDPGSGGISKIPVGTAPVGVAYGDNAVWVANGADGAVSRIDPSKTSSVRRIGVGNEPTALVIADKDVWTTVLPSPASHRGGTLRILRQPPFRGVGDSADPASWRASFSEWQALSLTNDGLVTYRRLGGLVGSALVPDLAVSLPPPTNGGRTYTFQLRRGIHYSNGELVRPEDFRLAIERVFTLPARTQVQTEARNFIRSFYTGIVGGKRCAERPRRCDLRRGIIPDDEENTVTFQLTDADPDFLYKLAFPMAEAVPAGTPDRDIGRTPLPATGPYKTQSFVPGKEWTLVRNSHFQPWLRDAQPEGFPDRIVLRPYATASAGVTAIERSRADVLLCSPGDLSCPPASQIGEFGRRYANQLRSDPEAATYAFVMNTRVSPFNHLGVRRALNYAVDRGRIVALSGGSLGALPTCQVLPSTIVGYRPYCPYTVDRNSGGSWIAPDFAKAQELVRRSGTRGMKVTVLTDSSEQSGKLGPYLASVLDRLGYRASSQAVSQVYPGRLADSRTHAQIGWFTWLQDYAAPSSFLGEVLTCQAFQPANQQNVNMAEFCSRKLDEQMRRATAVQTRNPAASGAAWSRIDHELTDQAPWVPLYNPRALTPISARVGNFQYHPFWTVLLDQLWVR